MGFRRAAPRGVRVQDRRSSVDRHGREAGLPASARSGSAVAALCACAALLLSAPLPAVAGTSGSIPAQEQAAAGGQAPSPALVLRTQHLLVGLGYPLGTGRLGGFGPRTRGAIEYFQRKYPLPVTGLPTPATLAAMAGVLASLRGVHTAARLSPATWSTGVRRPSPGPRRRDRARARAGAAGAELPARGRSGLGDGGGHRRGGLGRGLIREVLIAVPAPLEDPVLELAQRLA